MHNTLIGPTTAAIERPINRPRTKIPVSICLLLISGVIKKVARPHQKVWRLVTSASACSGGKGHAKRTKPYDGLICLLLLRDAIKTRSVSIHQVTPCCQFRSIALTRQAKYSTTCPVKQLR